ncbi:MAG: SagB/ThcOx family dehydrogenase [Dehalococcoidales bacterium]|nr:MAG: SagB/ThcOx family dehydrogenase [Dehalococcoidales bacterium]
MKINTFLEFVTILFLVAIVLITGCENSPENTAVKETPDNSESITLPEPRYDSNVSLEESLLNRRSTRSYGNEPVTLEEVSQLLWAAQGITDASGHRTAPSAVALYPLSIYVVAGDVPEIVDGVYIYEPGVHSIKRIVDGDIRNELAGAAMGQASVRQGAVSFIITVDYGKMTARFGDKGERFGTLEAGHAAQNLCLQATALNLGLVTAGAIYDDQVADVIDLPENLTPLYVIPVGRKLE